MYPSGNSISLRQYTRQYAANTPQIRRKYAVGGVVPEANQLQVLNAVVELVASLAVVGDHTPLEWNIVRSARSKEDRHHAVDGNIPVSIRRVVDGGVPVVDADGSCESERVDPSAKVNSSSSKSSSCDNSWR